MSRATKLLLGVLAASTLLLAACGDSSDDEAATTTTGVAATDPEAKPHTEASTDELEVWQKDLTLVGCWSGPADGVLGPQTEEAIKAFQQARGLTVDGKLGPVTERSLTEAVDANLVVCRAVSPTTTAAAGSGTVPPASNASVTVVAADYDKTFTVTSCTPTQGGNIGVVLKAEGTGGITLDLEAPSGTGTIRISGGTESDGVDLSGSVTSATVSDAAVTAAGTFSDGGGAFTVNGYCA